MNKASQIIFKAFLDKGPASRRDTLIQFLPPSSREVLNHLSPPEHSVTLASFSHFDFLNTVHPSWLKPLMRTLSESDLALFLAALVPTQQKELARDLGLNQPLPSLSLCAKRYLVDVIQQSIQKEAPSTLPIECLPASPFNTLLNFTYDQKLRLIRLLSMYDLANEEGKLIQKERRTLILSTLSSEEKQLLETLAKAPNRLQFKPMQLQQWDGNTETLRTLLHQRGINRLSKATYGTDPSFQWHLCHQLDTMSASLYKKLHTSLENSAAVHTLTHQAVQLISLFIDQLPTLRP